MPMTTPAAPTAASSIHHPMLGSIDLMAEYGLADLRDAAGLLLGLVGHGRSSSWISGDRPAERRADAVIRIRCAPRGPPTTRPPGGRVARGRLEGEVLGIGRPHRHRGRPQHRRSRSCGRGARP